MNVVERDRLHMVEQGSFCGITCAQMWADFYLWEVLLNERPSANAIVELGTWEGGFSRYLAAQADGRGMLFRTYDIVTPKRPVPGFQKIDIYADAESIGDFLERYDPLLLLCDGGNKPRELQTFSWYLSPDSLLVVHDWNEEITLDDVPGNVEEIFGDFCDEIGSLSRVFKVIH